MPGDRAALSAPQALSAPPAPHSHVAFAIWPASPRPTAPPPCFQDGGLHPSNRGWGATRGGGGYRGLPSYGRYSRGPGRGRGRARVPSPAPFRPQYFEGNRGRGRVVVRRDVPHVAWQDAN